MMPMSTSAFDPDLLLESEVSPTERAFQVIEFVARSRSLSTQDLISNLGIPKTTAHRLIGNLEEFGYLQHGIERGRYQVGPRLLELATQILSATVSQGPVHTLLNELTRRTTETSSLGVMRGSEVVYIDSAIGASPLTLRFEQGHRAPLHCTSSGRIFLANMDKKQLEAYMVSGPWEPSTPYTIVDPERLRLELDLVRKQGFATNDSEFVVGVVGAAVPIHGQNDNVIACLSLSAPKARKSLEELAMHIVLMQSIAARITRILTLQGEHPDGGEETIAPASTTSAAKAKANAARRKRTAK